jgi:hypothetical protein
MEFRNGHGFIAECGATDDGGIWITTKELGIEGPDVGTGYKFSIAEARQLRDWLAEHVK